MTDDHKLREWAELLGRNWEQRARMPSRDMFVASHSGWNDPERWEEHARTELDLFLTNLDPGALKDWDVLEIGCGSGRLVPLLRPQVRSYTGFDIAAGMVEAASERCCGLEGVRLFRGDGLGVPAPACDREYHLAIVVAVFIHCPHEVIAANIESAWSALAPGGQLRFQVLAALDDHTGIQVTEKVAADAAEALQDDMRQVIENLTEEERRLTHETYYMGHRFRYDEVEPFVAGFAAGGRIALYRGDPGAIYGLAEKPAP